MKQNDPRRGQTDSNSIARYGWLFILEWIAFFLFLALCEAGIL